MNDSRRGGRPHPQALLEQIEQSGRGRLKIFLGYAAGVGKTYRMLQQAHWRRAEGVEAVVGCAESHGRGETQALIDDLPAVPLRVIEYRGTSLHEPDIDAITERRPDLVLIDELAHTNAPGSRHAKRYQDVLELLEAGIDVYTTVNVQHIASLNDVVAQITGVQVRETVPDDIVDLATDIELVDLPPEELLQRMQEGRVYIPEQARRAAQRFFRLGNLRALRELTMRRAAHHADAQMTAYMRARGIGGPWPAAERLLVCVSPSPLSQRLIRTGKRLADELKADWLALYVETPGTLGLPDRTQAQVEDNLRLAEEMGATTVSLPGHSAADTVIEYAVGHNVTKIIVGKPQAPRWRELFRPSFVEQIISRSGSIDVYVINTAGDEGRRRAPRDAPRTVRWPDYATAAGLAAAAALASWPAAHHIDPSNLVMIFLLAVVLAALYLGRGPAMVASALSVLLFDVFFVPPRLALVVADSQYLITFAGLLIVGLVISSLAAQAREQARGARERAVQTTHLYELSRDLSRAGSLDEAIAVALDHVQRVFETGAGLMLFDGEALTLGKTIGGFTFDASGEAMAAWALKHDTTVGNGTETFAGAEHLYVPVGSPGEPVAVLGLQIARAPHHRPEQARMVEAFSNLVGSALVRVRLAEQAGQVRLLEETERLQAALLNSISHDLRTPLASITGVLGSLMQSERRAEDRGLSVEARRELLETAWQQAHHLNTLVGNLLDMTRLESGAVRISPEPADVQDIVGAVLERLRDALGDRTVQINIAPDLPPVAVDFVLITQALVNVVDNANRYSPRDRPLAISTEADGHEMWVRVADRGPGIPADERERVFDKFYRCPRMGGAGTGLGLSIARGIVEAHGGAVMACAREGGGAEIVISLPLATAGAKETDEP